MHLVDFSTRSRDSAGDSALRLCETRRIMIKQTFSLTKALLFCHHRLPRNFLHLGLPLAAPEVDRVGRHGPEPVLDAVQGHGGQVPDGGACDTCFYT